MFNPFQEEANNQESDDKAAALAAIEKRRMRESEKENIERKPFMDTQSETRKLRQDIFKRRHRARAQLSTFPGPWCVTKKQFRQKPRLNLIWFFTQLI
nr:protein RKD5 isoform X2 [Arachis hypogaea]